MIKIIFIRHGASCGNLERRYIGKTDEPLCSLGISQVEKLKDHFSVDRLFVSPMLRTRQSAEIIFPNMPASIVENMRETDFGIFEAKTAGELADNREYRAWIDSMCLDPVPEGESVAEFKERCCNAFLKAAKELPDNSTAAFVVHGGVIMAIMERFAVPKKDFYEYHLKNGEYILCSYENNEIKETSE